MKVYGADRLDSATLKLGGGNYLVFNPVVCLCLVLILLVLPFRPEIASFTNIEILGMAMVLLFVLSLGQGFVLITAGIDLSIPAVMSLCSVVGASVMAREGMPVAGGVAAMLLVGLATGALQGMALSLLKMPAFLVSLSALIFLGGVSVWYTQSARINVPDGFIAIWYGHWLGVPSPVIVVVLLGVAAHLVLSRTVTGRRLYAVGQNPRAALISGVPVARTVVGAYMFSGFCAALASIFYTARLYTGSPTLVENEVLLDCIGAAVIGGTSLFGGKGRVPGILLGVFFMALVGNSVNMLGLRYWHVILVKGGVILLAALLDSMTEGRGGAPPEVEHGATDT